MRNWLLGFSAGLLTAGLGFAQPCTLVSVEPLRLPEGVPTENVGVGHVGYAMGVYTLNAVEYPPGGKASKGWPLVSTDGRSWVLAGLNLQHPRQAHRDEVTGLLPPVYAEGSWVAIFAYGDYVLRSGDGRTWQEVGYGFDPILEQHPTGGLFWNGREFVKVGFWGGVWASVDGQSFEELTPAPNLYPARWAQVNKLGGILTDSKEGSWATRDFRGWLSLPFPLGSAVGILNGWLRADGDLSADPNTEKRGAVRTRDAQTYRYLNPEKSPWYGSAGRRLASSFYLLFGQDDIPSGRHYFKISVVRPGGNGTEAPREVDFEPNADLGGLYASNFHDAWSTFDGRGMVLVGSRDLTPAPVRLARFSCADFGAPSVLPGMAHQDGALGTRWRSDLVLHYPGPNGSEVRVEWLPYGQANENPRFARFWLNSGETKVIRDVVSSLFQAEGNGAIRVVWLGEERGFARGRTYNETASGTFGQAIDAFGWEDGVDRCYVPENESDDPNNLPPSWQDEEEMWLVGLADSGNDTNGFRSNVGLQNLWRNEAEVEVVWMGAEGQELGRNQVHLRAFEGVQWFRPLRELGLGPLEGVTAVVRVLSGDTRVAAYASVVDNSTGDGVFVRGKKDLFQGLTDLPWEREGSTMPRPSAPAVQRQAGVQGRSVKAGMAMKETAKASATP